MNCGLEEGGQLAPAQGVCPAATETSYDGVNGGKNAGRACWSIANTECSQSNTKKMLQCVDCAVMSQVQREEKDNFTFLLHNP
jgi:hypothetical protein